MRLLAALAITLFLVARPVRAEEPPADGYFVDAEGDRVSFQPVYEGWFGAERYPPRYARALGENLAVLGFELMIYWADAQSSEKDWQYSTLRVKLGANNLVRFDDNQPRTNYVLHPIAGAAHYGLSRVNGFGVPGSFAVAVGSSAIYETFFEWRELVSINDLIVTPIAGSALGEFLFQLGNYVNSEVERPRRLSEVTGTGALAKNMARVTIGLPRRGHDVVDQPPHPPVVPDDPLRLSSAYSHEFYVGAGGRLAWNDAGRQTLTTVVHERAAIVAMPGFLRPGRFATWFSQGNFTRQEFELSFADTVTSVDLEVEARLFGHYAQSFTAAQGGVRGFAREFSSRTGLRYFEHWLNERRDQYAIVHAFGPASTFWFGFGRTRLRLEADAAPDYAGIRALSYGAWTQRYGSEGTKSSLLSYGYYHAWGASVGVGATLTHDGFRASARARAGIYGSIDGLERGQRPVTREPHHEDRILELRAEVGYQPPSTMVRARVEATHTGRTSEMAPVGVARYEDAATVTVDLRF